MLHHYHRSRPEGRHHRTMLRVLVLPTLRVGQPIPSWKTLGRMLRINPSEGYRHMRRVLAEEGVVTEVRGTGRYRRTYVVSLQTWSDAA